MVNTVNVIAEYDLYLTLLKTEIN